MVNAGSPDVQILDDEWTAVTSDGQLSAHFEHTIAILPEGPRILTLPPGVQAGLEGTGFGPPSVRVETGATA
jgi:methionyl aminopeptidase